MKDRPIKSRIINWVLWIAFVLALGSSIQHLAWTFGTLERFPVLGWFEAVAVDAGLAALAYSIQQRKKAKRSTLALWAGVAIFALISGLANLYHALSVESGGTFLAGSLASADWLLLTKAVLLSATLPAMVIYLGEIVSSDDTAAAEREEREAERARKAAEKEKEAERLRAEQEAAQALAAAQQAQPEQPQFECPECHKVFGSKQALSGHSKKHPKQS